VELAQQHFREPLLELWQEAFGETRAAAEPFLAENFPGGKTWCLTDGGRPVTMASTIPQQMAVNGASLPILYVYAVATCKTHRGQGLASRLLRELADQAREAGISALLLVPAGPHLLPFYAGLGFLPFAHRARQTLTAAAGAARELSPDAYLAQRKAFLSAVPHNIPPERVLRHLRLFGDETGICAGEQTPEGLVFREALGSADAVRAAAAHLGAARCEAVLPDPKTAYAVIRRLDDRCPETGYFSLALE